jgi:hypothetical protein
LRQNPIAIKASPRKAVTGLSHCIGFIAPHLLQPASADVSREFTFGTGCGSAGLQTGREIGNSICSTGNVELVFSSE